MLPLDRNHQTSAACQRVFMQLAKDAEKLANHPVLAGWLYTTASRLSSEFSRSQARRQKREEQAMQSDAYPEHSEPESELEWRDLKPVLDLAMEELPEEDRHGIILRYFEGRDFASVGRELGLSGDAARMRVTRGLERLRAVLKRHRITSTLSALELLLAEHSAEAVPAGLAGAVAQSLRVLPLAAKAPIAFSGAKLIATVAALLLVIGGAQGMLKRLARQRAINASANERTLRGLTPGETTRRILLGRPLVAQGAAIDPGLAEALQDLRSALFGVERGLPERGRLLRSGAGKLVGREGETIALFREALNSPNVEIASMAIEAIGHFGSLPSEFTEELLRLLENPNLKESAGLIANRLVPGIITAEKPVQTLLSLLERRPDLVKQIGYLLSPVIAADRPRIAANREAVEALLQNPQVEVQSAARELLAELPEPPRPPNPEDSARITHLLSSAEEADRRRGFLELWTCGSITPEIRQALARVMAQDPSPQIRLDARLELTRFAPNDPALTPSAGDKSESSQSSSTAIPVDRAGVAVPELLAAIADNRADIPQAVHRLSEIDRAYWMLHPEEQTSAKLMLGSLQRSKDATLYEAAAEAYAHLSAQPRAVYPIEGLAPFFAAMESALSPGEHAIAIRDLRSSLLSYWKARGFIQAEPTHLPADLVQILFVGPFHENRPAYDEMLNAMRREVDASFQPPK